MPLEICIHLARCRLPNHQARCAVGSGQQQPVRTKTQRVDPICVLLLFPLALAGERVINSDHFLRSSNSDQTVVVADVRSHHDVELIADLGDPIPCGQITQDRKTVDAVASATDQNQLAVARESDRLRFPFRERQNT